MWALAARWRLGLASSSNPPVISPVLERADIAACFRGMGVSSAEVARGKPAPDVCDFGESRVLWHPMHEHERDLAAGIPSGPLGYRVCAGCGVAIQCRLASGHVCAPARYAAHQASRLHWRRAGFDDALSRWLQTPAGHFAQYYARRMVPGAPAPRPGEA